MRNYKRISFLLLFCSFFLVMCKSKQEITTEKETPEQFLPKSEPPVQLTVAEVLKEEVSDTITTKSTLEQKVAENILDSIRYNLTDNYHFYNIINSLPDYIRKVFPNVHFYSSQVVGSSKVNISAYYDGIKYNPVRSFNKLFLKVQSSNNIEFIEKIRCILFFNYGVNYEIIDIKKIDGTLKQFNIDYQYILQVKYEKTIYTFYLIYRNNQVGRIYLFKDESFKDLWSVTTFNY
ncbi:MAG: hypothetical protein JEY96_04805 [Bacteroidales bacterium]|nr:hypothetical protein [Bacteroidales bacterium]